MGKNKLDITKRNADISLRFGLGMAAAVIPLFLLLGFSIPMLPGLRAAKFFRKRGK